MNVATSDIDEIKEGQKKLISEISKLTKSIDNLAKIIGALVEKNNSSGNNSKRDSLNQSLNSNYSKNSSDTAFYRRRDLDKKKWQKRRKFCAKQRKNWKLSSSCAKL